MKKKTLIIIAAIVLVVVAVALVVIFSCNHEPKEGWIIDKEATVKEDGARHQVCMKCGRKINKEILYATGTEFLEYTLKQDDTYAVGYIGAIDVDELVIPAMHDGKPVTEIQPDVFRGTSCETLYIGKNIKVISRESFHGSIFKNVVFAEGSQLEKIEMSGFGYCYNLESIDIPASVTLIANSAFAGCEALKEVNFAKNSKLETIEYNAFFGCRSLEHFELPSSVTSIGEDAFTYCSSLKTFTFPKECKITVIPNDTFRECTSLESITIPAAVTKIENSAFNSCQSLKKVVFEKDSKLESTGRCAFQFCLELEEIELPASMTLIGERSFERCDKLTKATILSKTTEIYRDAFELHTVLYGYEGSTAEQHANKYNREFVKIN